MTENRSARPASPTRDSGAGRLRIGLVLGAGQLAGRGAVAAYLLVLIRELPRAEYGNFAYAVTLGSVLVVLGDAGFGRILTRDIARGARDLLRLVFALRVVSSLVTAILAYCLWAAGAVPFDSTFALAFAGWVLAEALTLGYEAVAAGAERPGVTASAQAASGAILLVFLGGLAATRVTPERAVGGLFVASAVKLAVQAGVWRGYPLRRSSAPAPGTLAALGDALPFFLLGTLAVLYYRVDLILLHAIRGALETATYAAAYRVVDAISIVGLVIFAALAPHFSRLHSSDPAAVWPEWQRYARRIGVACVAPAAVLILATPSLVGLLFGRAYATSAPVLRLLVPGVVFMLLSSLNGAALLMGDGKRTVIGLTALSLGLNVVVTAIGAAAAGAQGAAVATTVSEIATCALAAGLVRAQARGAVGPGQGPEASAIMPGQ